MRFSLATTSRQFTLIALALAAQSGCGRARAPETLVLREDVLGIVRHDPLRPVTAFDGGDGSLLTGVGWSRPGPTDDPLPGASRQREAVGLASELSLPPPPPGAHDLALRCHSYGRDPVLPVTLLHEDNELASGQVRREWGWTRLPLPDELFASGDARVELRFGSTLEREGGVGANRRERPHWAACSALVLLARDDLEPATLPARAAPGTPSPITLAPGASLGIALPAGATLSVVWAAEKLPSGCALQLALRPRGQRAFAVRRVVPDAGRATVLNDSDGPAEALVSLLADPRGAVLGCPGSAHFELDRLELGRPRRTTESRPNVLVYLVDTLRADAPDAHEITGRAAREFAGRGVRYRLAWSPASWTLPAVTSLFVGVRPFQHGVTRWDTRLAASGPDTLAERFAALGYQTLGISQTWLVGPDFGLDRGFEDFYLDDQFNGTDLNSQTLRAYLRHWYLYRSVRDRPLLAYFHSVDPHGPYSPPPSYRTLRAAVPGGRFSESVAVREIEHPSSPLEPADAEAARALYLGEVAYADEQFGAWLTMTRWLGLDEPALIALLSDHGEAFGEAGQYGHGRSLHEAQVRVPLVVRFPDGRGAGSVVDEPVSTLDLFASALRLAGAGPLDAYRGGRGLPRPGAAKAARPPGGEAELRPIGPEEERGIFLRAALLGTVKCVLTTDGAGRPFGDEPLWQAARVAASDLVERDLGASTAERDACERALRELLLARPPDGKPERFSPLQEQLESLRAVGYL